MVTEGYSNTGGEAEQAGNSRVVVQRMYVMSSATKCMCGRGVYLWCRKELRQVKMSRGTMAQSVITLLNFDSSTLRVSPTSAVSFVV